MLSFDVLKRVCCVEMGFCFVGFFFFSPSPPPRAIEWNKCSIKKKMQAHDVSFIVILVCYTLCKLNFLGTFWLVQKSMHFSVWALKPPADLYCYGGHLPCQAVNTSEKRFLVQMELPVLEIKLILKATAKLKDLNSKFIRGYGNLWSLLKL